MIRRNEREGSEEPGCWLGAMHYLSNRLIDGRVATGVPCVWLSWSRWR